MLSRGASRSAREPQAVQEELYLGASRNQQDLLNLWWKSWKEQGFTSLPPYSRRSDAKSHAVLKVGDVCILNHDNLVCGTYRLCRVLATQDHTGDRENKVRVSYRECCGVKARGQGPPTIIKIETQKLALLVPAAKIELQEGSAKTDPGKGGNNRTEDGTLSEVLKDDVTDESAGRRLRSSASPDDVGANMQHERDKQPKRKAERDEGP